MNKRLLFLVLIILLCGVALTVVSLPIPLQEVEIPFDTKGGMARNLQITIPRYLRLGDRAEVTLRVNITGANGVSEESSKLKANLQSLTLEVSPSAAVTAVIPVDGQANYMWEITPHTNQTQKATLWCFEVNTAGTELILARDIGLEVTTFIGMKYRLLRWTLALLMVLSLIIFGFFRYKKHPI